MSEPITPVPAATLLLLRQGPAAPEVLMMARHQEAGFAAGALVFPGGKVEAEDAGLRRFCAGAAALDDNALAFRVAAIRETFEECGILLARHRGAAAPISAAEYAALRARHADAADAKRFAALVAAAELELATDLLVPFAHWITPRDRPKRFDTLFFLAPAPPGQVAVHDGREAVDAVWADPGATVAAGDRGEAKLVFPTRMNLAKLARSRTVDDAFAAASRGAIVTVCPEIVRTAEGHVLRIPEEAGYGVTEMLVGAMSRA